MKNRDKEATLERLEAAILKVMKSGKRLSIKAVAETAGVDPSLVHHVYPAVAERIRTHVGKSTRAQRDEKHMELQAARRTIREQRLEIAALKVDMAKLASINLGLQDRLYEYAAGRLYSSESPYKQPL